MKKTLLLTLLSIGAITFAQEKATVEKTVTGIQIGLFGIDINSTGYISPNTSGSGLKKPQHFKVTMYGIAKRNGVWHGSKINTLYN